MAHAVFRASQRYQLVVFDRLLAEEKELLGDLRRVPGFYGVLRPASRSGSTFKVVDRETALLIYTLREAGPLPGYVLNDAGASGRLAEIYGLVLDGVLEVLSDDSFLSGPEAMSLLSKQPLAFTGQGFISRLSQDALRYVEALQIDDIESLVRRLYTFHTIPFTPRWQRIIGDSEAIERRLGIEPNSPRRSWLASWGEAVERRNAYDWLGWARHSDEGSGPASAPTYKLYLSPVVEAIESVFETLVDCLPGSRATAFKIGGDAVGLLRPDKLVVYFEDFDDLSQTAMELGEKLKSVPAHGVPFTAEIAGDGLLSWGTDPPRSHRVVPWQARESWRLWVVRRLAAALVAAQQGGDGSVAPWRFALERLRLRGVDVKRWTPQPTLWLSEA